MKTLKLLALTLSLACSTVFAAEAKKGGEKLPPALDVPPIGTSAPILNVDFEDTAAGQIPKGFTKQGAVSVVEDVAHSGKKSLKMEAAVSGGRQIVLKGDVLKQLGGTFWGRFYYKVQTPTPMPEKGVIHSTMVAGSAQSPSAKDPIEVRMLGSVQGAKGTFQYLYNVQPRSKRPEFGKGTSYRFNYSDQWTLAEWYVDYATQTYRLFINGEEVTDCSFKKGEGKFEGADLPEIYESLTFGWCNYQQAGKGFVCWIDDIALAKDRIGTRGIPGAK